ncbi:hypothetical protein THAOC_20442 [Thalassiosira oceanica]|uniref:Uncharacterized protein n=1 Tax=Thalassiosira oceanica TaxID=159749 RepID=K0S3C9_THAOC|nr:hypothetical protein THAOC_20442 [Thalassiosira oceanica]|eukprot:EJK59349.1 hypothetical protein THAOC_20442 [Thalassiosira oceanica]
MPYISDYWLVEVTPQLVLDSSSLVYWRQHIQPSDIATADPPTQPSGTPEPRPKKIHTPGPRPAPSGGPRSLSTTSLAYFARVCGQGECGQPGTQKIGGIASGKPDFCLAPEVRPQSPQPRLSVLPVRPAGWPPRPSRLDQGKEKKTEESRGADLSKYPVTSNICLDLSRCKPM